VGRGGEPDARLHARLLPAGVRPVHRDHHAVAEAGDEKNAKARRLRELHPELQIRILYQRDYVGLLEKYGLEEPEQWKAS